VLALTDTARTVIRDLTAQPDVPAGCGLRIAPTEAGELELSLAPAPAPDDEVIDTDGALLFVEQQTAQILADRTLDAKVSDEGAGFYLTVSDTDDLDGLGDADDSNGTTPAV